MNYLDQSINDIPDAVYLPDGAEVVARIVNVTHDTEHNNVRVLCEPTEYPAGDVDVTEAEVFSYTLWLPKEEDEPRQVKQTLRNWKNFFTGFSLPFESLGEAIQDTEAWKGASAWVLVSFQETEKYTGNNVKKILRPA